MATLKNGGSSTAGDDAQLQRTEPIWLEILIRSLMAAFGLIAFAVVALLFFATHNTTITTTKPATPPATGNEVTTVVTQSPASDTLVVAVLGLGAILVIGAAFYGRLSKLSVAGLFEADFAALGTPAAKAVSRELAAAPAAGQAAGPELAARAAAATNLAASYAGQLITLGKRSPNQLRSVAAVAGIPDDEVEHLVQRGAPDDKLWQRLARMALDKVSE